MEAFLAACWQIILEFWPATIIDRWELGIRVRWGTRLVPLAPGLRVLWPFMDKVLTEPSTLQTATLSDQSVSTRDRVKASFGGIIFYHVVDLKMMWLTVHDGDETLVDLAMVLLAEEVEAINFKDCHLPEIQAAAQRKLRAEAKLWGIYVDRLRLTDLVEAQVIRLMTPTGNHTTVLPENE